MSTAMPDMSQAPQDAPTGPPAAPQEPQGVFQRILTGALSGLANAHSGGGGLIGGGLASLTPGGAEQQQVAIAQHKQAEQQKLDAQAATIKFTDAQAAASVASAARNNAITAAMPQEARDAHDTAQLSMAGQLQQLGITPTVIASDDHDAAKSALEGLTTANGAVPHLFNLEVGGQHLAYDLSQLSGTPQGLTIINSARAAQGQEPITAALWSQTPKAAQAQTAEKSLQFWAPPPTTNAAQANGLYLQYKSFSDAYAKKPDADPQVKERLDKLVSNLKTQRDGQVGQAKDINASNAYANASAQKQGRLDVDRKEYQDRLTAADVTGWKPAPGAVMSEQQFNAANTKFVSGALAKAQDTDKSYTMFQNAFANRADAKSGAESMLALSQHLATTFGTVKGARVTKDMIEHHLGARSVSDTAQVAAQKLVNGDVLSENQWNEFRKLITDARTQTWNNTVKQAHSLGLPVTQDMLPQQKGRQ